MSEPWKFDPTWRCVACDFTCGDDGPDVCPNDGCAMTRCVGVAVPNESIDLYRDGAYERFRYV